MCHFYIIAVPGMADFTVCLIGSNKKILWRIIRGKSDCKKRRLRNTEAFFFVMMRPDFYDL